VGETTKEEEIEGKRRDTPQQGTSVDTAGCMDGTQLDQNIAAEIAQE